MQHKHRLFKLIAPWAKWYRLFKWLSIIQLIATFALPVIWPDLDTGVWLLSFAFFAFWLSSYALVRMAHHHDPEASGFKGWLAAHWENALFVIWVGVIFAILLLFFKLVNFMWGG
jgi:hypothetical protein